MIEIRPSFLLLLSLLTTFLTAHGQERNPQGLLPETDFVGETPVLNAIFPLSIVTSDTAIMVRNVFISTLVGWNIIVVCDPEPISLNFWGEADRLSADVCAKPETFPELFAYATLRSLERELPEASTNYGKVMKDNGYDPNDRGVDKTRAIGMGNVIGMKIADFLATDGWNALGDLSRRHFKMPFEDYSGYTPVNSPWELKYPLRWQPLQDGDFRVGRYSFQAHVVPYLGQVRTFLMSEEEVSERRVENPYADMSATELVGEDAARMDILTKEVLDVSSKLTPEQRFFARWWDSKFASAGVFGIAYQGILNTTEKFNARWNLGDMIAQHDALILAWKEKIRIDAVRPKTIVNTIYGDKGFIVYSNREKAVTSVLGKDWEPLIPTQPHSEFPSASACLCTAFADFTDMMLKEEVERQGLSEVPPFSFNLSIIPLGIDLEGKTTVEFSTMKEAAENCGLSRLWAGVHFSPAIPAGEKLAEGVGMRAYQVMKDFDEGRVPANCWWCSGNP